MCLGICVHSEVCGSIWGYTDMKLPFPKKDGVSVLVDTYSDNDVPLAISQVEIIIRGSDVVIRMQDGSELVLIQAAQMASMHENLFNLNFADGTVVSSNQLFQRADLIEPGPELSDIKENNAASDVDTDPLVVVVQSSAPSEASNLDAIELASNQTVSRNPEARLSVSDFIGQSSGNNEEIIQVVKTSSSSRPMKEPKPEVHMPDPMMPEKPTEGGDNNNPVGVPFIETANLYQISNVKMTITNDDNTVSSIWSLGGGSLEARTNPDLGVQYGQPAVLDLRGVEGEEHGFIIHADNDAFRYKQINTADSPNNLDRRLGRIVTFDQLVGGKSVAGQTIKDITGIPENMTIIWKGSPDYADFVAKYGIELKDNEIFVNYKADADYSGNIVSIKWTDADGNETVAKSEFTNQYNGEYPTTVIDDHHAIVLSNKPNAREIHGGEGDDTVYASQFNDKISYDGGGGTNRIIFGDNYPLTQKDGSNTLAGLEFNIEKNTITDLGTGDVAGIKNFSEIIGTKGDDHFISGGTATSYYLDGLEGNNVFDMVSVNKDTGEITGSGGNNQLFAGNGQDRYNLVNSTGNNTIVDKGGDGSDDSYDFTASSGVNKITDSGGADHYVFDRASNSITIDDFAAGNDNYSFHNIANAAVTINDRNKDQSLSGDDVYDFATVKTDENAATATDFISDSVVNIVDENGNDAYQFERTKGGSVTITDQGSADGKTGVQDDRYSFSESSTKVNISDQDGADIYNFNKSATSADNTITINDNSGSQFADTYNFDDITSTSWAAGEAANVAINDNGGDNIFNFNRLESKVKIDQNGAGSDSYNFSQSTNSAVNITDKGVGKDVYNFFETKDSTINITDVGDGTSGAANDQDDIYNFSKLAASNPGAADFIENTDVVINDGRGNDIYYFERTKGGSVTINDTETSSNPSSANDVYYFNNSKSKINISDAKGSDIYNFNDIDVDDRNTVTINDTGNQRNTNSDTYNFANLKASGALSGDNYHVNISDYSGADKYNFNDLGDASASFATRVKIYDKDGGDDVYSFLRANNAYVNIRDTGDGNDDQYLFSNKDNSGNHMTNSDIYIRDDVGQDKYYFNGAEGGSVTIDDYSYWKNYFYFDNIKTKVKIYADGGDDYYYFRNSITSKENTISITNMSKNDNYDFSGTTATSLVDGDNYNIDINDRAGNENYKFFSISNTKLRITDGGGFDNYNFGSANEGDKIVNSDIVIIDNSGSDHYNFLYAQGGTVDITDKGKTSTYDANLDNYDFSHSTINKTTIKDEDGTSNYNFSYSGSDSTTVKIVDQNGADNYDFKYAKGNITIFDGGTNPSDSKHERIYYDEHGQMHITGDSAQTVNIMRQTSDIFDFRYSSAKVKIVDGIKSGDTAEAGVPADNDNLTSDGIYYFQYSEGDATIVNKGGLDKYYLGGSTGKISIVGGSSTDIVYVGKGYLVYDGGTRTDGGKENDWISFQDVLENTDKNGNTGKFDPNERVEGIYINLADTVANIADRSKVNYDETTGAASIISGQAHGDVKNVEHVIGSKFSDLIYGDAHDNYFLATQGGDIYYGGGGSDTYFVGAPNIGGRIDGIFYDGVNPTITDRGKQDNEQMGPWAANPDINPAFQKITIDLDKGYATTLWNGSDGRQGKDYLHDINNAYGALNYTNEIIGRWGTEGRWVGGYKADKIYSVANSSKDGISYIDGNNGNDKALTQNDELHYDYVHTNSDGTFDRINGVYVKMDGSFSGTTLKGFTGFDDKGVAQGTQGNDHFKSIGTIFGSAADDFFEGHESGGHKFVGGGGKDTFVSNGGANSSYTNGDLLDYSRLNENHSVTVDMYTSTVRRDLSYVDTISGINNIKGTKGNDSVIFTDKLIGFDGDGGTNYMMKKQSGDSAASEYQIASGFKNVQGISFIDDKKDNVNVDFNKFFADYITGSNVGDDGKHHAKFFLNGDPTTDGNADIFNKIDSVNDDPNKNWSWRLGSDDGHGNQTWYAQQNGSDTGDTISVIRGSQGDNTHLQESHPSM